LVEPAFGQSSDQWHLSAFETDSHAAAAARPLAFVALAARLA